MNKEFFKNNGPTQVWINCPSTLQPYNNLHGQKGVAIYGTEGVQTVRFYFGDKFGSLEVNPIYLSKLEE